MSTFDVSVITSIDSYFENLAHNSCCGASSFVKKVAKAVDVSDRVKYLEQFSEAPDSQLSKPWRDKAKELLSAVE
jgi:hypothetical protein